MNYKVIILLTPYTQQQVKYANGKESPCLLDFAS